MRTVSLAWIREYSPALIGSLVFVCFGILLIPYPGLQQDEVIFAPAVYQPASSLFHIQAGKHTVPMMLITYLGATNTWIYNLIFQLWNPPFYSCPLASIVLYASTI